MQRLSSLKTWLWSLSATALVSSCAPRFYQDGWDLLDNANNVTSGLGISSFTILDPSPTNAQPVSLGYGTVVGSYDEYCIQENLPTDAGCVWTPAPLPPTFSLTEDDGPVTLYLFLRDTAQGTLSNGTASNSVLADRVAPALASAAVTNASPTSSTTYNLTYGAVTGIYSHYCIRENDTSNAACSWVAGTLPGSFTVSATQNAKTLSIWIRDLAGNVSTRVDTNPVTLDTQAPQLASVDITNPAVTSTNVLSLAYGAVTGTYDEYCILENSTTVGSCTWTAGTLPNNFTASTTQNAKTLSVWIRDQAGNVSNRVDSDTVTLDTTAPTITLTSLTGGQTIGGGSSATITWTGSDANPGATPISIEVSSDGGSNWSSLSASEANDGTYTWNPVPSVNSATYRVRVTFTDAAGNSAQSASGSNFTINSSSPVVTVTSPNGGEFWPGGASRNITWTSSGLPGGASTAKLEYSVDGGTNWTQIATGEANDGTYAWTTPSVDDPDLRVRVTVTDSLAVDTADTSDSNFTIDSTPPTISLTQPNGGEVLTGGASYNIGFSVNDTNLGTNPVLIERSNNSGGAYANEATNVAATNGANTYAWTVPSVTGTTYRIRVSATDRAGNTSTADASDADFSINSSSPTVAVTSPNGAEAWAGGASKNITWTASGLPPGSSTATLEYSTDGGSNWTQIASGVANASGANSYSWTVASVDTTQARVRVTVTDSFSVATADASDANFTIDSTAPALAITSPAADSWINAASVSSFNVQGTCNEAGRTIAFSGPVMGMTTCSGTNFSVNLDFSAALVPQGAITLLADMSDAAGNYAPQASLALRKDTVPPTVTVTAPNGGESWMVGASQNITWTASDATSGVSSRADLDYRINGGSANTIATNYTGGSPYSWTVANAPSTQVRVHVTAWDEALNSATDSSNANFTIFTGVTPSAPTSLSGTPGHQSVALSWTASATGTPTPTYEVLRSTTSGSGYVSVTSGLTGTTFNDTGLTNGVTYYYVVRATNAAGTSGDSNEISAVPNMTPSLSFDFTLGTLAPVVGNRTITWSRSDTAPVATHFGSDGYLRFAPHNMRPDSETLSGGSYTWHVNGSGTSVAGTGGTAPDGTNNKALLLRANNGSGIAAPWIDTSTDAVTPEEGVPITCSIYAKASGFNFAAIRIFNNSGADQAFTYFDLSNGTVASNPAPSGITVPIDAGVQSVGNGWYRIWKSVYKADNQDVVACGYYADDNNSNNNAPTVDGNGTNGILLWGAQLEQNRTPSAYIKTTTSPRYDGVRFAYDPRTLAGRGLLAEEGRTNLIVRTTQFDNASWTKTALTVTADNTTAPDGTPTADRLTETTANSNHRLVQSITKTGSSQPYTGSIFVKPSSERRFVELRFSGATGSVVTRFNAETGGLIDAITSGTGWTYQSSDAEYAGNGWWRVSSTVYSSTETSMTFGIGLLWEPQTNSYAGNTSAYLWVWGAQLELGRSVTSYIPTIGSTATRERESGSFSGGSWYSSTAGTWIVDYQRSIYTAYSAALTAHVLRGYDASFQSYAFGITSNNSGEIFSPYMRWYHGGGGNLQLTNTQQYDRHRTAFTVTPSDLRMTRNGGTPAAGVSGTVIAPTNFVIGGNVNEEFTGHIRELSFYKSTMANADMTSLTAIPASGFSDDFDDNTLSDEWCLSSECRHILWADNPNVPVNETGGKLVFSLAGGGGAYEALTTARPYNFYGASATVELVNPGPSAGTPEVGFVIEFSKNYAVEMYVQDGNLVFERNVAGTWSTAATQITYNSTNHRWLRFRHDVASNTIKYETSPDASTWTIRASVNVTTLASKIDHAYIGLYASPQASGSGQAEFDNFSTTALKH